MRRSLRTEIETETEKEQEQEHEKREGDLRERETSQPLSPRKAQERQDQKLLHGEIKLYREKHGREPNDTALAVICQKNRIPFEYGRNLLTMDVAR